MVTSTDLPNPRHLLSQLLNFALVLSTAFMLWKTLSLASDSPSPIVVVLSGSMEPAFQRGDLLFLWNRGLDTQVGEVVVYNVRGKDIPIVHRVVRRTGGSGVPGTGAGAVGDGRPGGSWGFAKAWNTVTGSKKQKPKEISKKKSREEPLMLLTKGDNNSADDLELYAPGQKALEREKDVIGSVVGFVPWVGYGTILLSEYPWLKKVMLAGMGLMVVLSRE